MFREAAIRVIRERQALRERLKTTDRELNACPSEGRAELLRLRETLTQELMERERLAAELCAQIRTEERRLLRQQEEAPRWLVPVGWAAWVLAIITLLKMITSGGEISRLPW